MTSTTTATATTSTTVTTANTDSNHEEIGLEFIPDQKDFRLNARRIFITIPKCDVSPQEALTRILSNNKTKSCACVIAREQHADGTPHLHILLSKTRPFNINNPSYLDFIGEKRGNYQKVRFFEACLRYVTKKGEYIAHKIDVDSILQSYNKKIIAQNKKKQGKSKLIWEYLNDGKTYEELVKDSELGPFLVLHSSSVKRLAADIQHTKQKELKLLSKPIYCHLIIMGREFDLLSELPFKTKQFWIHGPPNTGKTSLIRKLEDIGLRGYQISTNNDFANYDDALFDFCYIDEFKGQLTIQFLNEFLQGSKMYLPGKYVIGGVVKNRNLPIFILSNYTPEQVYHKKSIYDLAPLISRLNVFEINNYNDYQVITESTRPEVYLTDLYTDEQL